MNRTTKFSFNAPSPLSQTSLSIYSNQTPTSLQPTRRDITSLRITSNILRYNSPVPTNDFSNLRLEPEKERKKQQIKQNFKFSIPVGSLNGNLVRANENKDNDYLSKLEMQMKKVEGRETKMSLGDEEIQGGSPAQGY